MQKPVLAPQLKQLMAANNPIGMELTADDVQAWFDVLWLSFSTYEYKNQKRALLGWWSRVTEQDIEKARSRAARIADEAETARLEAFAADLPSNVIPIDHFAKLR